MKIIKNISEITQIVSDLQKNKKQINLIPTMGNIHAGHLSLLTEAKKFDGINIVSIFVNPAQFNEENDFTNYPKTFDTDVDILAKAHCEIIFAPSIKEIYPRGAKTINETSIQNTMPFRIKPIIARFLISKNANPNISIPSANAIFEYIGTSCWTSESGIKSISSLSSSIESEGIVVSLRVFCQFMKVMNPSIWTLPSAESWSTSNSTSIPEPLGNPSEYSTSTTPVYHV